MKFTLNIDGRQEELEVVRLRDSSRSERSHSERSRGERLRITRDGQTIEVRVVYRDGPHFVLEYEQPVDGQIQRRRLRAAGYSDGDHRQLWVNGSNVSYERLRQRGAPPAADPGALSASIPAIVSEILVTPGERVSAGQKLILLESMKMILPIQAPQDGIVSAIHCQPGEAVQPGVVLVEIGD